MRRYLRIAVLLLCFLVTLMLAACGTSDNSTSAASVTESSESTAQEVPEEVADVRDAAMTAAQNTAKEVEGYWVDRISYLVPYYTDDTVKTTGEYLALQADLVKYAEEEGASDMYVLVPDDNGDFQVTIATEDVAWFENKGTSSVYDEAYKEGYIAAERSGWEDNSSYYWTACSPLYNQAGEIYGILVVDYPADILKDYPEWDRDSADWNHYGEEETEQ